MNKKVSVKALIQRVWQITASPNTEWNKISEEQNSVFRTFVFPFITTCCLIAFWGLLLNSFSFIVAVFETLFLFFSMLGSICIVWKIDCFLVQNDDRLKNNLLKLVTYSFVPNFLLQTLMCYVPTLFFLKVLALHSISVFLKGYDILAEEKNNNTLFIVINAILIVFLPWLLSFMCNKLWE